MAEHLVTPQAYDLNEDDPRLVAFLPRRRDRRFVAGLIGALSRSAGIITDDVVLEATVQAYALPGRRMSPEHRRAYLLEKGRQKLGISDVAKAIAAYYELAAGFSLQEAAALHVRHIKGEITKEQIVTVRDGPDASHAEIVQVRLAPNYAALKDFLASALPKEPKRIEVHKQSMSYNLSENVYTPPPIDATPVGVDAGRKGNK